MVHVHQKPVSQAEQTSCDKPQAFLNKSKDLDHVPLSKLPDESQVYAQIRNNQLPALE